ncbi:MAG: hypothetical protein Q8Q89_05260 [bacterium]|nr:hypothetical protein [bacterium]
MKKLHYISSWVTIISIVVGMFSFDNFRDFLYLLVMLTGYVGVVSGIWVIIRKLEK